MSARQQLGSQSGGPKILRIGIVQRGKIIEEREVKKRETITIGSGPKCMFQVASERLPKSFDLFEYDGKNYYVRFEDGIEGRIQLDEEQVSDFRSLEKRGLVVQRGGKRAVRLSERSRGKVMLADGDVTVLFQFKTAMPAPARPVLPPHVRGSVLNNIIDTQFAAIFVVVALLQMSVLTYARSLPYIEPTSIDELSETYQKLIMPDRVPEPPRQEMASNVPAEKKAEEKKPAKEPEKKPAKKQAKKAESKKKPRNPPPSPEKRRAKAKQQVAKRGLLGVIGTTRGSGGGGGALADVFREGGASRDMQAAFSGIKGVDIATKGGEGGTRGRGSGEAVDVGNLSTRGGGNVSSGKKSETRVTGELAEQAPEVDGSLDPSAIRRVMNRKKSGIKACYENALKRNRQLSGKLVISFEINERGRLQNLSFGGSLSSKDLEKCIGRIARSWRFPRPDGGPVFVDYPIVFTPSN